MTINIAEVLDILAAHDIIPEEDTQSPEAPVSLGQKPSEFGEITDGETVYTTSIADVFREDNESGDDILANDDPRIHDWWESIQRIRSGDQRTASSLRDVSAEPPDPHCAWYCPIHFFGHSWGIYIRESCILSHAKDIAAFVDWRTVHASPPSVARQLLRSAFYVFFLHEQFHHKVESLGFRLLVSTGTDRYRPYKANVYRTAYLTSACLEESLANAESFRRLNEPRYTQRVDKPIRDALRNLLRFIIPKQPPGYSEGAHYFQEAAYRSGLYKLQSQALDGLLVPTTPLGHWSVAPNMITALTDITDNIYVVLPKKGASPIFRPTSIDPGATVSTSAMVGALTKHYGYQYVPGGKGSHVKLKKPGAQTIILPGNRPALSPGVVKHALDAIGGHPLSKLPDVLEGKISKGL
jgi:predicted RNA binding protein YcfA (HicA-like mRNA interferase family)